jgi:hypothetical protein
MQIATVEQALQNVSGSSFVGLDTITDVKLTGGRANPQQGRVSKRMTGAQVMVFQNRNINGYEAMIRRRLEAEGKDPASFVLGERAWGQRLPNSPIVVHKKGEDVKFYLEVIFLRAGHVEYLLDGQPVPASAIQGLPVVARDPDAQGGLDNQVVIRTFGVDSITCLRIDGQAFQ